MWSDLNMTQRSELMKLYLKNGITSLSAMKEHYNSYQDGGRLTFQQWKAKMQSRYPDIEMDNNKAGYNYEAYFNNHYDDAIKQLSNLQHFPDTYKLPNHPTFSNESIYSRGPVMGGSWINDSTFTPSVINKQYYPNIYKEDRNYTEREIYQNRYATGGSIEDENVHKFEVGGPDVNTPNFVGGATALKKDYDYILEHLAEKYPVTAEGPWHDYGIHNPSYSQRAHWNELSKMYNRVSERSNYQKLNPTNILEYTPIIGDTIDAGSSIYDLQQGNIGLGLAGLGMLALPNIIEKPLKAGVKGIKKLFKNKSDKAFNKYWNQLQDTQQLKAPTVRIISEPSVEITKPIFKHSLVNYNPERYPFEVSSPLGLTHTISGKDLAKIIEYSNGKLPAPSIAISSWDGIRTGRAPYPVHYDDGRYTFYFRPDYIDNMPHEAYEFDMFTPTYKNAETWAGRSLNPTEVVDTKRQMFNEFGTLLDLQRGYDLKSHKKLTDANNYRSSQSLQEASKALKKSPNRDYGEIMPLSFVDLRQAPLIVGEGSENPLVLDFLKKLNTHKITTHELFNIKGLSLKNGGRIK